MKMKTVKKCGKKAKIEELTNGIFTKELARMEELLSKLGKAYHPYEIGKNYFIRTVTHHFTGRLAAVTPTELVLEDAAWIADDGRFHDALKTGVLNEIEPFPDGPVIVGRGSLIDACVWNFSLPRVQK